MKIITRRKFIGSLALGTLALTLSGCKTTTNKVTFGIISDVHKGLQPDAEKRLQAFIDAANIRNPDFIVQLGDLTHGKASDVTAMVNIWDKFQGQRFHVLGNHDMDATTKEDIIEKQAMPGKYYSFDVKNTHFVVLDCNYILKDGEYVDYAHGNYFIDSRYRDLINEEQLQWLAKDLEKTNKPVVIFSHQGIGKLWKEEDGVPNREQIREVINNANNNGKQVIACLSGHHHVDYHEKIDNVYYMLINSASYYYCSEPNYSNKHLAEYKDPLYAFITLDYQNNTITVDGMESVFIPPDPSKEKDRPAAEKISANINSKNLNLFKK